MTAAATAAPFPSAAALRAEHERLQAALGTEPAVREAAERVGEFVRRAVQTGTRLDAKEDRKSAQAIINYWVSRGTTAGGSHPFADPEFDSLLADFDEATLGDTVAAADAVLADAYPDGGDPVLARRLFLRLMWLRPDGKAFDPVPVARSALHDLGPTEEVDRLVRRFADAGVLRVTPGANPTADQVALRSADLPGCWPALQKWQAGRKEKRQRANAWADPAHQPSTRRRLLDWLWDLIAWVGRMTDKVWAVTFGRLTGASHQLLDGDELAEAYTYHDRTDAERRFLDKSRAREQRSSDRNRFLMGLFGLCAAFAAVGWVWAVNRAISESTSREAAWHFYRQADEERKAVDARRKLSALRLVVRGQAEVVNARTEGEQLVAKARWESLVASTPKDVLPEGAHDRLMETVKSVLQKDECHCVPKDTIDEIRKVRDKLAAQAVIREALREVRKVSFEMVRVSADNAYKRLATSRRYGEAEPFAREFWAQYWGEMLLVEGKEVADAMVKFGNALDAIRTDSRVATVQRETKKGERPDDDPPKKDGTPRPSAPDQAKTEAKVRGLLQGLSRETIDRLVREEADHPISDDLIRDLKTALDLLTIALKEEEARSLEEVLNLPK